MLFDKFLHDYMTLTKLNKYYILAHDDVKSQNTQTYGKIRMHTASILKTHLQENEEEKTWRRMSERSGVRVTIKTRANAHSLAR